MPHYDYGMDGKFYAQDIRISKKAVYTGCLFLPTALFDCNNNVVSTPTPTQTPIAQQDPTPTPTPTSCNVIADYKFFSLAGVYENRTHISSGESNSINFDVSSSTVGLMNGLPTHIDNGGPTEDSSPEFTIIDGELHLTGMKIGGDWIYSRDDLMQQGSDPQHGGYNDQGLGEGTKSKILKQKWILGIWSIRW